MNEKNTQANKSGIIITIVIAAVAIVLGIAGGVFAGKAKERAAAEAFLAEVESLTQEAKDYYNGTDTVAKDLDKAGELFAQVAEKGNEEAYYYIGRIAEEAEDYATAKENYEKVLENEKVGNLARLALGQLYQSGNGVDVDYAKAKEYYEAAVANGCVDANNGLGDLYQNGYGVEQDGAKAIEYEIWNPKKNQSNFVVYFKGHITRGVYPIPRFIGALAAVETSTEIGKFHLNNILNNLTSSAIINFNNGEPSEEEKKRIEKRLNDKFSGANNAGKNMIVFNNNKESAVTVERLSEDNFDKKFETLAKSTREEIFISCRATPALFGLNPENNGFSKAEFLEAFELYNKTVVKPIQNDIKRVFDKLFNVENSLIFNKFTLEDSENKAIV